MQLMRRILVLLSVLVVSVRAGELHVSPAGRDDAAGSRRAPVATLQRAQKLAREQIAAGLKAPLTVVIHEGTYRVSEPLIFTAADSGTKAFPVTWRAAAGKHVTISGGYRVARWVQGDEGIWQAPVKEAGMTATRELFVNGQRAIRAREPNAGAKPYAWRLLNHSLTKDRTTETITVEPDKLGDWTAQPDNVEIVVIKNWASYHKRIQSVDAQTGALTMMPPNVEYRGMNRPKKGIYYFFENARAFLDEPGEWHLDPSAGMLYYKPRPGEDMTTAEAIIPRAHQVLLLEGTEASPVQYLVFADLTFAHNRYLLPPAGHHGRQAAFAYQGDDGKNGLPAMLQWQFAQDCVIRNCVIAHGGSNGLELRNGCHRNLIEGNRVHDIAGNGLGIGGHDVEVLIPTANRLRNNIVQDCGAVFMGACGIWVGFARESLIEHNHVFDLPYTGISVGWVWGTAPSLVRDNVVAWNHIHDVMQEVGDGGGIYTLGHQPGSILRCNHIHDVRRGPYAHASPNNGIFFDEGSKGFLVERNLIYRTSGAPTRHNRNSAAWQIWRDNVFGRIPAKPAAEPGDSGQDGAQDLHEVMSRAGIQGTSKK